MLEILFPWILFSSLSIIILVLLVKYLITAFSYFSKMDMSSVIMKPLKIPSKEIELNAKLILPKIALDESKQLKLKIPLIFLNHGWNMNIDMKMLMQYAIPLAIGGPYAILVYECRGHGKTPGKKALGPAIFDDIPNVISFGENLEGIDPNRLGFMGMSFGGEVSLARAYPDERIKAIVAMASPHDAKANFSRKPESFKARFNLKFLKAAGVKAEKISDEENQKISPRFILDKERKDLNGRVFLIHSKHDSLIPLEQAEKNRELLGLPDDQVLFLEKGGHAALRQTLLIISSALRFFKSKL